VNAGSDLVVGLRAEPEPVSAGEVLTYTATITNLGPLDAVNVTIASTLPPGVTLHSIATSPGLTCDSVLLERVPPALQCALDSMPRGTRAELVFAVTVPITISESFTHSIAVTSATLDPNLDSNLAQTTVLVNMDSK